MKKVTPAWLDDANAEFDLQNIEANDRAEKAEKKFRNEFVAEAKDSDDFQEQWDHLNIQIDKIYSYFLTQTNKERGHVGLQFVGIYYFRGTFCDVRVPLVMGAPRINALTHLFMPLELCAPFGSDVESVRDYVGVFADTYDYGYGIEEVENRCPTDFSRELFRSANKHLKACISLLAQNAASSKAIEEARSSVEIFLKAYLAMKEGFTDDDLRSRFGHRLDKLVDRCIHHGLKELVPLRYGILRLPDIQTRYEARERTFGELWAAYRLALQTGLGIIRPLTGRDCRKGFAVI